MSGRNSANIGGINISADNAWSIPMSSIRTNPTVWATPEGVEAWRKNTPASPAIADLTPAAEDKSVSGLVSSLTDLKRQKVQSDTKLSAESDRQQAKDKMQRDHAFAQEGVAAAEIPKPWDADKEHKRWESDPI